MIELDEKIKTALDTLGITRYACILQSDGRLQVGELPTKIGCVVETIASSEELERGLTRIESYFYFFSFIKQDLDVLNDVNPKMYDIVNAINKFKKELKKAPYNVRYPNAKTPALRYQTNQFDCGMQLTVTFDLSMPC